MATIVLLRQGPPFLRLILHYSSLCLQPRIYRHRIIKHRCFRPQPRLSRPAGMENCTTLILSGISSSGKFLNANQRRYYRGPSTCEFAVCEWSKSDDVLSVSGSFVEVGQAQNIETHDAFGNEFSHVSSSCVCCDEIFQKSPSTSCGTLISRT